MIWLATLVVWPSPLPLTRRFSDGRLITVLDDYALDNYDIMAVTPQQRYVPAKIRFFIDMLKAVYKEPGYWTRSV
jgi:DNA-binding transcriptional LysR family regulator